MTGDLNEMMGVPVVFSTEVPRPGMVVMDRDALGYDHGVFVLTHPDEEPHLWMAVGETSRAFLSLKRILNRQINAAAHRANLRLDEMARQAKRKQTYRNEDYTLAQYADRLKELSLAYNAGDPPPPWPKELEDY
jgi:hypothetical protein